MLCCELRSAMSTASASAKSRRLAAASTPPKTACPDVMRRPLASMAVTPTKHIATTPVETAMRPYEPPSLRIACARTSSAPGIGSMFAAVDSTPTRSAAGNGTRYAAIAAATWYSAAFKARVSGTPNAATTARSSQRGSCSTSGRFRTPRMKPPTKRTRAAPSAKRRRLTLPSADRLARKLLRRRATNVARLRSFAPIRPPRGAPAASR